MIIYILLTDMILSFCLLTYFGVTKKSYLKSYFKVITSIFFVALCIAAYLINSTNFTYFIFILTGLIFSLFGDILLEFDSNRKLFLLGIGSFALAHIFYTISFIYLVLTIFEYLIIAFILFIFVIYIFKVLKGFNFKNDFPYICIYIFIIMFMVSKSFSLFSIFSLCPIGIRLVTIGAFLFMISDLLLCFYMYYSKCPKYLGGMSLFIYYFAQALIALSVLYI